MLAPLFVLLISTLTFFRRIDAFPLRNWDEAWYAEIIKNMASGQFSLLAPYWNGQYYFDKPPLYFWLTLPIVRLFGPGEWQMRVASVSASVLATLLVYLIGKRLFDKTTGLISSVVFLTLGQVVIRFAHGNLDALLVCFILLTFYLFLLSEKRPFFLVLSGISLGFVILTKGPLLALFPILWIIILFRAKNSGILGPQSSPDSTRTASSAYAGDVANFEARKREPRPQECGNLLLFERSGAKSRTSRFSGFAGLTRRIFEVMAFALLSSGWWLALGTLRFGKDFVNWYVLNPSGNLLTHPLSSFSLSYFQDLLRDIGFWFILVGIFLALKVKVPKNTKQILISFLTITFIFTFYLNFLSEKLGWYNLPAYPLVALIIGYLTSQTLPKKTKLTMALLTLIIPLQIINAIRIENIYPDRSRVGAQLGQRAKNLIPKEDTIILDDRDFPSFLYYSEHKEIFVVTAQGPKPSEWWILNYADLPKFLKDVSICHSERSEESFDFAQDKSRSFVESGSTQDDKKCTDIGSNTWIITPNIKNLPPEAQSGQIIDQFQGYKFLKINSYGNLALQD